MRIGSALKYTLLRRAMDGLHEDQARKVIDLRSLSRACAATRALSIFRRHPNPDAQCFALAVRKCGDACKNIKIPRFPLIPVFPDIFNELCAQLDLMACDIVGDPYPYSPGA